MRRLSTSTGTSSERMALSRVSVSVADRVGAHQLRAALADPAAPHQSAARSLLEEASETLLAGLVLEGFTTWQILAEAAERYPPARRETAAWLRDMARLAVV